MARLSRLPAGKLQGGGTVCGVAGVGLTIAQHGPIQRILVDFSNSLTAVQVPAECQGVPFRQRRALGWRIFTKEAEQVPITARFNSEAASIS